MDDTPIDRNPPAAPQRASAEPGHSSSGLERDLHALTIADPALAPDLADAIAERLGAVLAGEDDGADTPQA